MPPPPLLRKQERRGGIETASSCSASSSLVSKQERRGGIETVAFSRRELLAMPGSRNAVVALKQYITKRVADYDVYEAGTPWWH